MSHPPHRHASRCMWHHASSPAYFGTERSQGNFNSPPAFLQNTLNPLHSKNALNAKIDSRRSTYQKVNFVKSYGFLKCYLPNHVINFIFIPLDCYQIFLHLDDFDFLQIWRRLEIPNTMKNFFQPQFFPRWNFYNNGTWLLHLYYTLKQRENQEKSKAFSIQRIEKDLVTPRAYTLDLAGTQRPYSPKQPQSYLSYKRNT